MDEIWDLIESVSEGFPTYFLSASKITWFAFDMVNLVSYSAGGKSRGTDLAETFDIPNLLCRMFILAHVICSRDMLTGDANSIGCLIHSSTSVIHHDSVHMCKFFLICCCCGSSKPVIISEALLSHFKMRCPPFDCCMRRRVFPNVATISA